MVHITDVIRKLLPQLSRAHPTYKYYTLLWDLLFLQGAHPDALVSLPTLRSSLVVPDMLIKSVVTLAILSVGFVRATPLRYPRE